MIDIDVLCAGATTYDMVFQVSEHPGEDDKIFADNLIQCGGGPAANAAVAVSRLGLTSAFIGYLGNDVYGDEHLRELQSDNVECSLIQRGDNPTPLTAAAIKPDGKRTMINYRGPKQTLPPHTINFRKFNPKVILVDGHEPEVSLELIEFAKQNDIPTILDAGSVHRGTNLLYDKVDYLITSEKFAYTFTHIQNPNESIEKLSEFSPNVIITLGDKGLVWKNKFGKGEKPAFKVKAADTTGAGDAFHAGFAFSLAKKMEWHESLEFASAVAAITCTKMGARISLPTDRHVNEFLKTRDALDLV